MNHDDTVSLDDVHIEFIPWDERVEKEYAYRVIHPGQPLYLVTRRELRDFLTDLYNLLIRHEGEDL